MWQHLYCVFIDIYFLVIEKDLYECQNISLVSVCSLLCLSSEDLFNFSVSFFPFLPTEHISAYTELSLTHCQTSLNLCWRMPTTSLASSILSLLLYLASHWWLLILFPSTSPSLLYTHGFTTLCNVSLTLQISQTYYIRIHESSTLTPVMVQGHSYES